MTFPGTVPVTAQPNEDGVTIPAGWAAVYRYEPEDVAAGVPDPYRRIAHVALRVPWGTGWREVVTDGGQLGAQDPGLVGDYYYQFVRLLELVWYARLGLIGSGTGYGQTLEGGEPLVMSWTCQVVSGGGSASYVGLSTAPSGGRTDPRRMALWGGATYSCIQPGDVIRLGNVEAMVCGLPDLSVPGTATVSLHKPIYAQAGDVVTVFRQKPAVWWPMPVHRAKWVEELRTDWIPKAGGPIELKRSDGGPGAIAWPYRDDDPEKGYRGHFRAWGRKVDGSIEEVTGTLLEGFPGLGSEPRLSIYTDEGGVTHTYVTPFEMEHTLFRFRYVMEAVAQNSPDGATQWKGSQSCCKWVCRDWSNQIARAGTAGTKADMNGRHWFCEKRFVLSGSFYLNRFHEWCHQTECPCFAQRAPWRLSVAAMLSVAAGRNLYLQGEKESMTVARAQNPSLFEMAGMPGYTGDGTKETPVIWYGKNGPTGTTGLFGVLEDVPVAERQADEGAVKRLRYGAIKGTGAGVLAQGGAFVKADRCGGRAWNHPEQYDDGSDYYAEEAYQPLREMPTVAMDKAHFAALAGGRVEAEVQRVRTAKVRVPGIRKGQDATIDGVGVKWEKDGEELTGKLTLTIPPMRGRTFGAKTLSDAAATVERAVGLDNGNVLLLEFLPEQVTCAGIDNLGNAVDYTWLSAGGTVCAKNEQRIFNPKATSQNRYGSMGAKVCRGDSIRFTDLEGYENELLTVIWAKAHAGAIYSGAGAGTPPNGASVPAIYQTQAWRLAQDVVYVDLPPGRLRTYLETAGTGVLVGRKIEAAGKSVAPPVRSARVENGLVTFSDTGYTIRILHFEQGTPEREEQIPSQNVSFDPANGAITIAASETEAWSGTAPHHLAVLHGGTGSGCYLFYRGESLCAEHLTYLREALRRLTWFEAETSFANPTAIWAWSPYGSSGDTIQMVMCSNGAYRPMWGGGTWNKTFPASLGSAFMTPYGSGAAGALVHAYAPYPESYPEPGMLSEHSGAWDKLYFRVGGGGPFACGSSISSGDVTGYPMIWHSFRMRVQALEVDPDAFGRWRPEWIGQALMDVMVTNAVQNSISTTWTWSDTEGMQTQVTRTESRLDLHLAAYVATPVTIPGTEETGYVFEAAGVSPFSLPAANRWTTVDVTAICRAIAARRLAASRKVFFVIQPGNGVSLTEELRARDFASSCFEQTLNYLPHSETNPGGYLKGEPGDQGFEGQGGVVNSGMMGKTYLTYEGLGLRNLKVRFSWDDLENENYLPHRLMMSLGGNMPAMA